MFLHNLNILVASEPTYNTLLMYLSNDLFTDVESDDGIYSSCLSRASGTSTSKYRNSVGLTYRGRWRFVNLRAKSCHLTSQRHGICIQGMAPKMMTVAPPWTSQQPAYVRKNVNNVQYSIYSSNLIVQSMSGGGYQMVDCWRMAS